MPGRIGGVFVGVSSQEDPRIPTLRYAARDAERLAAVFADAAEQARADPTDVKVLVNQSATVAAVVNSLAAAVATSSERSFDLFMVHISCHGLHTGHLVLHDAVYGEGSQQALPLATLNGILAGLRASTMVVTLDICFGGTVVGMLGSANREALHAVLEGLAGQNRAIAWAASADEPAHESHRARHGYLSMGLLGCLTRAREAGNREIAAISWLNEAMGVARDEALRLGKPQSPQMTSRLGPDAMIPVPALGPRQSRLAQAEGATPVTTDLVGLETYGFSAVSIGALRTKLAGSPGLNDLQLRAISPSGVLAGRDVLIRAPTSAGKTLIAELSILRGFHQGLKSVVLVPTRALASEHARVFGASYQPVGLRVIRSAGDSSDDDDLLMRGHFDVAVLTYEKFANLVYRDVGVLDGVRLVVLDEIQLIRDAGRGRTAELLLALLQRRRQRGLAIQLLGLCGDFTDLGGLPEWLGAELVGGHIRPVPLRECVVGPDGRMTVTWRDDRGQQEVPSNVRFDVGLDRRPHVVREQLVDVLVMQLVAEGKQVLVFRTSRPKVLKTASRLAAAMTAEPDPTLVAAFEQACQRHERSRITGALQACLRRGVAFHSSQLEEHERAFIEEAFRQRRLRVLVATTTLAAGVNLPAHAVIVADHGFWNAARGAEDPLPTVDYRNMVGRAGRAGQGMAAGDGYLVAGSEPERTTLTASYLGAGGTRLEAGFGSMSADDRTLAAATVVGKGSLLDHVEVLSNTFWGYQNRHLPAWREQLRQETDDALEHLAALGLLTRVDARNYTLTQGGAVCAVYGVAVKSAERVLIAVDRMIERQEAIGADELLALSQLCVELDEAWIPDSEGATSETWRTRLGAWGRGRPTLLEALQDPWGEVVDPELPRKRLKRTALLRTWVSGHPVDEVEAATGAAPNEPVLGYVRDVSRRTSDVLPAVAGLVAGRQPARQSEIQRIVETLRPALEFGVTLGAAGLQQLRLGLTRKQSLALAAGGITTLQQLEDVLGGDSARIEGILTTPVVNEIRALLANRSLKRRRQLPSVGDGTLDLFPDGPLA